MLQKIVDFITYNLLNLDPTTRLSQSINFFIYDVVKILLLLFVMIAVIGFFRTYLPRHKIKKWLSGKRLGFGNLLASLFGAITPFCSCSSIPVFMGFLEAGIPLGVALSFLITSPLINEYLVVLMLGFFGIKITVFYVVSGILIGTISGMILGKMGLEKYLVKDLITNNPNKTKTYPDIKSRIHFGLVEAKWIVKKILIWLLAGVGLGAVIHNYIPQEYIQSIIGKTGIFSVPIATLLGIPMYGNCVAIVPVAVALFQKGIPIGTTLAFMMAIVGLSLPEAIILKRVMKLKLILVFFAIVGSAIIIIGYLLNYSADFLLK